MESVMTNNVDTRKLDARRLKKLIEEDRKKDVFEIGTDICEDAEWVKKYYSPSPTPKN
tara:strand:- start:358 stop:531 length:174 start_codon:yes stop_codon:yes gene_type:complete